MPLCLEARPENVINVDEENVPSTPFPFLPIANDNNNNNNYMNRSPTPAPSNESGENHDDAALVDDFFTAPDNNHWTIMPSNENPPLVEGNEDNKSGVNYNDDEYYRTVHPQQKERWGGIDVLVSIFFLIAAGWLLAAILYSAIILLLLRLQARGELDVYEQDFGLLVCCRGRVTVHLGCILRRYAIQLEREQQQRRQAYYEARNSVRNSYRNRHDALLPDFEQQHQHEHFSPRPIRIMTREERRCAMEHLLTAPAEKEVKVVSGLLSGGVDLENCKRNHGEGGDDDDSSEGGPICTICLGEYGPTDQVFTSNTCSHRFHKDCIMSWLERRDHTECPVCRECMVSDDDVWEVVQAMRRDRRRKLQRENGLMHRSIQWVLRHLGLGHHRHRRRRCEETASTSGEERMMSYGLLLQSAAATAIHGAADNENNEIVDDLENVTIDSVTASNVSEFEEESSSSDGGADIESNEIADDLENATIDSVTTSNASEFEEDSSSSDGGEDIESYEIADDLENVTIDSVTTSNVSEFEEESSSSDGGADDENNEIVDDLANVTVDSVTTSNLSEFKEESSSSDGGADHENNEIVDDLENVTVESVTASNLSEFKEESSYSDDGADNENNAIADDLENVTTESVTANNVSEFKEESLSSDTSSP